MDYNLIKQLQETTPFQPVTQREIDTRRQAQPARSHKFQEGEKVCFDVYAGNMDQSSWEGSTLSWKQLKSLNGKVGTVADINIVGPDSDYISVVFDGDVILDFVSSIHFERV